MTKSICFINDHVGFGGVGTATKTLASSLAKMGHQVTLVTLFKEELNPPKGVTYIHLGLTRKKDYLLILPMLLKLKRFFKNNAFDLTVSAKDFINIWVLVAFRWAKAKGKILVNTHTTISQVLKYERLKVRVIYKVIVALARVLYPMADTVANVSKGSAKDSENVFGLKNVVTLYNPVVQTEDLQKEYDLVEHKFFDKKYVTFVTCGRLETQKNQKLMLQSFAKAYAKNSQIRLIVLGDGRLRAELEELAKNFNIQDVVSFDGFVNNARNYMAQAHGVLMTSYYEGLSVVMVESMLVGTPLISTDSPHGAKEVIDNNQYGLLIESFDADDIATAILKMAESPKKSKEHYHKKALEFEVQKCAESILPYTS